MYNIKALSAAKSLLRTLVVDIVLITLLCLLPTVSHLAGVSFRYLEPMRIALFAGLILIGDKRNGYVLAVLLPLFSMLTTGLPTPAVCAMIIAELSLNVFLLDLLCSKTQIHTFFAFLLSIVTSKVIFHIMKWMIVSVGLMSAGLLVTEWRIQLAVSILLSGIFSIAFILRRK